MSKYCGACGATLEDDARVCGYCGRPCGGVPPQITGLDYVSPAQEEQKKVQKKRIKLIAGMVIAAAVFAIVVRIVVSFTGYNKLVRDVMKAYTSYDIEKLVDLSSDIYSAWGEEYAENYYEREVGSTLESLENSVGHNHKLSYEVEDIYTVSDKKFRDTVEALDEAYLMYDASYDTDLIGDVAIAEIKVIAEQGARSSKRSVTLMMIQENGKWKLLEID